MIDYILERRKRKTVAIRVENGRVTVFAPLHESKKNIDLIVESNAEYIEKHLQKQKKQLAEMERYPEFTPETMERLAEAAKNYIPGRAEYYASKLGVSYGRITFRFQKTRWGSCSSKKNLNFNCLLMLLPKNVIESVVVHELCHLKHMNHSNAFYAEVLSVFPDYPSCEKILKDEGAIIMLKFLRFCEQS